MAWIESHTVLLRHRKLIELAKELRLRNSYTLGHLHALWHAALEQQEDGDLSKWTDGFIADSSDFPGDAPQYVRLLQKHGWLDGKLLHDWIDYAGLFLTRKYSSSDPERLRAIWKKHGREYGANNKRTDSERTANLPNQPNLTNQPNQKTIADFDSIWEAYPRKLGRKTALRHFAATVKSEADLEDLKKALVNYKLDLELKRTEERFIQHGSTWFNNWRDWVNIKSFNPIDDVERRKSERRKSWQAAGLSVCHGSAVEVLDDQLRHCVSCLEVQP